MLPSAVIVEATIRSAKLERAERPAHALPSAPDANPPPYSRRPTRNLEPINRRVIEPATLPSHSSTSVVREKYLSQNRISNRNSAKNRSYRKQTTKPSLTETRIAFLPGLPRAILAKASHCRIEFLPGSGQNIECDVTYSKQTTGRFLPGATTACFHSPNHTARGIYSGLSNRQLSMRRASPSRESAPRRTTRGTCSAFSNRELTMRRVSASRARSATRGICFAFSNRELDLLERLLNHRKQTTATRSNRELTMRRASASRVSAPWRTTRGSALHSLIANSIY